MNDLYDTHASLTRQIGNYSILSLDIKGNITACTQSAESVFGSTAKELIGRNFDLLFAGDDAQSGMLENLLATAQHHGESKANGWFIKKDGTRALGTLFLNAQYNELKELQGFTLILVNASREIQEHEKQKRGDASKKQLSFGEEELTENNLMYRNLFASNPMPMWVFDLETYHFLDVNDIACVIYGYTREEFLRMSVMDIRPQESKEAFATADHPPKLSPEEYQRGSWQHLKKDGSRIDVEIAAHDIVFNKRDARMIVVHDVTKRKQTEQKLEHHQYNLEQAQKMAHFGHWELNFATGKAIWSKESCRIYGLSEEDNEHTYDSWLSFIHPEDLQEVIKATEAAKPTFEPMEICHRILLKDGTIKHVCSRSHYEFDFYGRPVGMYGVVHDITGQRLAEQKLTNANRLYAVTSGINQLIAHADNQQRVFDEACRIATELGKFELAWIGRVNEENRTLQMLAHSNGSKYDLDSIAEISYEIDGPVARVIKSGSYHVDNDANQTDTGSRISAFVEARKLRSFIVLPIKRSGKVFATLNLFSAQSGLFNPAEIMLLEEVAADISFAIGLFDRKAIAEEAEKRLQHSELRLRQAQSIAHFGNWELDFSVGEAVWSEEHCRIYGLEANDNRHTFESWLSYIHPEDREHVRAAIEGSGETFSSASLHHRIVRKDGAVRHIYMHSQYELSKQGTPVGLYGVSHDITESKEAEFSLVQSEANLRLIMDLLPQRIFVKGLDGKYLFVNNSFADIYGMEPKELIQASRSGKLFVASNVESFSNDDQQVIREGRKKVIPEETFIGPSGKESIFHVTKLPFFWGRTAKQGVLGILHDITEQKRTELERDALVTDIIRRNESLEQFAYIISHNLRAPVANILALSDMLATVRYDAEETESLLNNLSISTKKLDEVIRDLNQILGTAHQSSERREKVNFADLCKDVQLILGILESDQVRISTYFSAIDGFYGVKSYWYSIFENLISNSLKYRNPKVPLNIKIFSKWRNDRIELIFEDNGLGMDLTRSGDQLFGLYKRFHTHVDGKGMGLYLVKRHVETMGGQISVQSEVGKGTTFTLTFANPEQHDL